jgi:iron complex transport system substrate-binding protein
MRDMKFSHIISRKRGIDVRKFNALAVMLLIMMFSCAASGVEYPLTLTDGAGREITLEEPIDGIIVMNGDALEAVSMLGSADKIVGMSNTAIRKSYLAPDAKTDQSVGKWNEPDLEKIGELAQDYQNIVLITYSYPDKPYGAAAFAEKLEPFPNVTVVGLDFFKPATMVSDIESLGEILGQEDTSQDFVDWYDEKVSQVEGSVQGLPKPKVYVEWNLKGDLSTLGSGSGFDGVLQQARGENIATSIEGEYPKVDWEWVISQEPEVIIKRQTQPSDKNEMGWDEKPSQDTIELDAVRAEILERSGAAAIPAVKSGRVYLVDWDIMNGLDQVVGLTYLAKLLHPEADLDPQEVHQEYLQRLGLNYPQGKIFVYPEMS